jgi:cell division inhibitor SepF
MNHHPDPPLFPPSGVAVAVPAGSGGAEHELLLVMADRFEDAQRVINAVRSGRSVVLNAGRLSREMGQRLVDYACGGISALEGQSHRIGEGVFLLATLQTRVHPPVFREEQPERHVQDPGGRR